MSKVKVATSSNKDPHKMTEEECKKVYFDAVRKYREEEKKKRDREADLDFFDRFNGGVFCHHKNREAIKAELTCLDCGIVLPSIPYFYKEFNYNCYRARTDSRFRHIRTDFRRQKKYDLSKKTCADERLDRVVARYGVTQHRDTIREDFVRIVNDGDAPPSVNVSVICYQLLLKNGIDFDKTKFKPPPKTTYGDYAMRLCAFLLKKVGWTMVTDG